MRRALLAIMIGVVTGCAESAQQPTQPQSQRPPLASSRSEPDPRYHVDRLPTLSGNSQGAGINDRGSVAGFSTLADGSRHAAFWRHGAVTDLGTLGAAAGLRSNVQWPGLSDDDMVVGISQTATPDSLGETWSCAPFLGTSGHVCLGFAWDGGMMKALPTLGGENGFATGVNGRGQVVGWAETAVHDPTCNTPQVLQFRAVMWEPRHHTRRELRPYPGDSTSAATAINERGQAVGISGECDIAVGRKSATHAVLWEGHSVTKLGSLGGNYWHTPMAINNRGVVVGFSNPPNGDFDGDSLHAFVWTREGGMKDLGMLPHDVSSQALGINDRGQIVGLSCGDVCAAVLWQDGKIYRLQDLVPGLADALFSAKEINDRGQITGRLIEAGTNKLFAFVATPIDH